VVVVGSAAAGAAAGAAPRHYLCVTVHHAFCDRHGLRALRAQLFEMLARRMLAVGIRP